MVGQSSDGGSSPLPLPLLQMVGKRPVGRRATEGAPLARPTAYAGRGKGHGPRSPWAPYSVSEPPLAAPAVRHGSNPYMSEQ